MSKLHIVLYCSMRLQDTAKYCRGWRLARWRRAISYRQRQSWVWFEYI